MGDTTPQHVASPDDSSDDTSPVEPRDTAGRRRSSWAAPGSSDAAHVPASAHGPDKAAPSAGRRLLARIPGLSQLADQSGGVDHATETSTGADRGWVFHEAGASAADGDSGAFEGWL